MNRIQFWIVTGLSGLVVLLLAAQILLVRQTNLELNRLTAAQQYLTQAQAFQANLKQLALRIVQDSQKTQDQGLKDLLTRQQITFNPTPADGSTNTEAPAPSPVAPAPTTR